MKSKVNGESISKELIQNVIKIICAIWFKEDLDIILEMDQHDVIFVGLLVSIHKIIFITAKLANMTSVNNVL